MSPYFGTVQAIRGHSYNESAAGTAAKRARHFEVDFLSRLHITDTLFLRQSLTEMLDLFAMYTVHLGMGHTLMHFTIKEGTIRKYLNEAGKLIMSRRQTYKMQNPQAQLDWYHPLRHYGESQMAPAIKVCLDEIKRLENVPNRREPLTTNMIYFQQTLCSISTPFSEHQVLFDFQVIAIYSGIRLGEWAQNDNVRRLDQIRLNIDGTATAFIIGDLEFYGRNKRVMSRADALASQDLVLQIDVRWRFQKNGEINKKKSFLRVGLRKATLCSVSAWLRVVVRWEALHLPDDHPLAVFTDTGLVTGNIVFIRPTHINAALQLAARKVYNITDEDALARFTSHSYRVGATVYLHAAGISQMDIKFALRWKGDSFYIYLRNLPCQAARTHAAVLNFNPNVFSLVPIEVVA
jgi:hypothetical protein